MFALIPRDVWFAAALCIGSLLAAVFDPSHIVITCLYIMLTAYIVVGLINDEEKM